MSNTVTMEQIKNTVSSLTKLYGCAVSIDFSVFDYNNNEEPAVQWDIYIANGRNDNCKNPLLNTGLYLWKSCTSYPL